MKNKKGFTLVELLAVIAILGIILSITTISVVNTINKSRKEGNEISEELIKNAVDLYIAENSYNLKQEINKHGSAYVKIQTLIDEKYLKIKDSSKLNDSRYVQLNLINGSVNVAEISNSGPVELGASDFTIDGSTITAYNGTDTNIIIPSEIGGVTINSIANFAFDSKNLTRVIIPNSVTSIGMLAFANNKLTRVTIPNSVISISVAAFANNKLTSVTIPNSVISISDDAFANNNLTNVTISNSVTSIGLKAFSNNMLPDSQAFIYKRNNNGSEDKTVIVSYGGSNKDVVIPNGVTEFHGAFYGCDLKSVVIPNTVTHVYMEDFAANYNLESITIKGKRSLSDFVESSGLTTDGGLPSGVTITFEP